jgi:hypothetical protein
MAGMYNTLILRWTDHNGLFCTNFWCLQDQANDIPQSMIDLADAAQQLTPCGLVGIQYQKTLLVGQSPQPGPYSTVYDRALLNTRVNSPVQTGQLQIPGLLPSILKPDNITIDLSNANVVTFIHRVQSTLALPGPHAINSVYAGRRSRVRYNQA